MKKDAVESFQFLFDYCFVKQAGQSSVAAVLGYNRSKLECEDAIFCRFRKPEEFLDIVEVDKEVTQMSLTVLIFSMIIFRVIAYLMIDFRIRSKRLNSFLFVM
jgi:hypothetical protein